MTPTAPSDPAAPDAGTPDLSAGSREGKPADDKILKLLAIASAAREWATERNPEDYAERALLVALFDAFPGDFPGRENCGCDQSEMVCDECPSIHEIRANIAEWRSDLATAIHNQGGR